MRVSAKADYAVRAAAELAAAEEGPVKGEKLADAQDIPLQFLEHILLELKHAGIVRARRGAKGGYWLARPADEVTIADLVRAVEGPCSSTSPSPTWSPVSCPTRSDPSPPSRTPGWRGSQTAAEGTQSGRQAASSASLISPARGYTVATRQAFRTTSSCSGVRSSRCSPGSTKRSAPFG